MNKLWLALILVFAAVTVNAQETETRNLSTFSGVKAAEGVDVYLKKGTKESVKIEVSGAKLSDVITEVSGSFLKIHMANSGRYRNVTVKAYVTYVKVDKLSASSGGSIFSEETIKIGNIDLSASSAGSIEVSVDVDKLNADASSAGEIEVKGKANSINVEAGSAGQIDAYDLESNSVQADASSGGSVKVFAVKSLMAQANSGGEVRYRGNPDKSMTNSNSGGSVKKSY